MRLFVSLLAFLLFLCLARPCIGDAGREMVVVFKGDTTEVPFRDDKSQVTTKKPRAFRSLAAVSGVLNNKEFFAVFCDAHYDGFSDSGSVEQVVRTSYGDHTKWSAADIFASSTWENGKKAVMGNVTAVMKGNKIYALVSMIDGSKGLDTASDGSGTKWDTLMFVGTVVTPTDSSGGGVTVKWEEKGSLKSLFEAKAFDPPIVYLAGGGSNGVVTKNGTIVIPVQGLNINKYTVSSIIYSTDDGATWHVGGLWSDSTLEGSVVEWENEKLLLSLQGNWGSRIVLESSDMGATWNKSIVLSYVWGNEPKRFYSGSQGSVVTAPVDGKDVLFFSHPLNKKNRYTRETLQLWVSDGKRIFCVGTISEEGKKENTGNSILAYVGTNLYVTHEINPFGPLEKTESKPGEWDNAIALSPLPQFFESAKNSVRAWRRLDAWLHTKGIPSEWLVGFLGNTKTDETVWTDMYNCVNATVKGGKRVSGGFRFNGKPGSGAEWPVSKQGQNRLYQFTSYQFTLAATVQIHSTTGAEGVSLLGVATHIFIKDIMAGIGFTEDRKWKVLKNNGQKDTTEFSFLLEKEYHVAITFGNGVAFVYVDGLSITNGIKTLYDTTWNDYFYMGRVGVNSKAKGSSCTVKNIMLFNRNFESEEILQLSKLSKKSFLDELVPDDIFNKKSVSGGKKLSAGKGTLEQRTNGDGSAAASFAIVAWMCFVCFIIALSGV